MRSVQKYKARSMPLARLVTIPPKQYASTNIENDDITTLKNYLPSASTLEIIERFSAGLQGAKSGRMLSITGPYGSGKSTMAVFLNGLLAGQKNDEWNVAYKTLKNASADTARILRTARGRTDTHKKGPIRCIATARREPITATILRALDDGATRYFGKYAKRHFSMANNLRRKMRDLKHSNTPTAKEITDIISSMCQRSPIVIIIDEFGKNIEYFTTDESQQSDLFLLQELAELSGPGRKLPLSIITLQHMAFEEYAVGTSMALKQEWAKIQGRFEDIPFANSPDQTRLLISNTIELDENTTHLREIENWAKKESKQMQKLGIDSGFDSDLVASCYPLEPLALEVLPELCSRYGQHERTLLSFISDASKHTVATFIDENTWSKGSLPAMGIDILYDYFIAGTSMIHSSSANITRLMEIETIIRDSHGLSRSEIKTLKTIGILNLIGRSGYLRASRNILEYVTGTETKQILQKLEEKSIITYRKYADEYRIWHGTDIDIAAKLNMHRKRYQKSALSDMLHNVMNLEPVVAAKHSIETGTMRIFERQFASKSDMTLNESYDGVIMYNTSNHKTMEFDRPLITVDATDTSELHQAAIEVMAIRDILNDDKDVTADWVARKELEERLADSEIILDRIFDHTYGSNAKWSYLKAGKATKCTGTPSTIVSQVCNDVYNKTPRIYNEMINRTLLSPQGSAAKRNLMDYMMTRTNKPRFGIEGYGPDRAVYEAIFIKNGIHVKVKKSEWILRDPKDETIKPVWHEMLSMLKRSKKRVSLSKIYQVCKMPPFGMKEGVIAIFVTAILLVHKNNIALYEHGTYVPYILPEIAERMVKNPDHFELKYFKSTTSKKELLAQVIKHFEINSKGSVLDVVSHLVRIVSTLPPYVKQTKKLDSNSLAVRDAVLNAIEPDTLLFESLPKALKFDSKPSRSDIGKFAETLTNSKSALQNEFHKMIDDIKKLLFDATGIDDRKKLSKTASVMLQNVTDQKMKIFLTAVATDALERDEDWINYVALSLTDVPPMSWKDDQRDMFENNLILMSKKFKILASLQFANVSKNFIKPSYQVTVTHADGSEHHNVVSIKPAQKKKLETIANKIMKDMKKKGFKDKDVGALIALLSSMG